MWKKKFPTAKAPSKKKRLNWNNVDGVIMDSRFGCPDKCSKIKEVFEQGAERKRTAFEATLGGLKTRKVWDAMAKSIHLNHCSKESDKKEEGAVVKLAVPKQK